MLNISLRTTMGLSWIFVVIHVFLVCDGFLLDDRTNPATTPGPLLTDQHYNALISLIMNERQARTKLEQHVVHLEKELLATQQGVTDIYHTSVGNNATLEQQTKNWNALYAKYNELVNDNTLIKTNFDALRMNHSNLESYTKLLEQGVASLQQLKGVTDLQTVLNVRNETDILREELKVTKNSLNTVRNEAEARKQDFVGLLKKVDSTEFFVKTLDSNLNNVSENMLYTNNKTEVEMKVMRGEMQKYNLTSKKLQQDLYVVKGIQDVSIGKLDLEIHNMSNRAAFTSCSLNKVYPASSKILFPSVKTKFGVSDSTLSDLGSSGVFKCEKAGLYLISAFLMTPTKTYVRLDLYQNSVMTTSFLSSVANGTSYQTSTILILKYVELKDTLYIKTEAEAQIWGGDMSCFSFLQLTN